MFNKSYLGLAISVALLVPVVARAEVEVTAVLKNETAAFVKDGTRTGEAASFTDTSGGGSDLMKFENSAKIFFNDDIGEESSWHGELNLIYDAKGVSSEYKGHEINSQHDWLRELYVDTNMAGWDFRLGKQQVVWGTADGMKLLDVINPTDYREFSQNTMEDSRIPVWMVTGEREVGQGGNVQFVVAESARNRVAGLNISDNATRVTGATKGVDSGHAFVMKGVDTITGGVNGFLNIGAAMGGVTSIFYGGNFTNPALNPNAAATTVGGYTAGTYTAACNAPGAAISGAACLENFTDNPVYGGANSNNGVTNLIDADAATGAGWDTSNPNSTWEYMPNATFATFNAYVGMGTKYKREYDDDPEANLGLRYRGSLDSGLNWGVNYLYAYDPNPVINIHWENSAGEQLAVNEHTTVAGLGSTKVYQLSNQAGTQFYGGNATYTDANYTDGVGPTDVTNANNGGAPTLVFEEKLTRVHNLGTSFDYAFDTAFSPIILRGEFLYQKDIHQPVIDRSALAAGNLTGALTTQESDFFKYVVGADVTVAKNLLISGQFIQFRNLDYVDENKNSIDGSACGSDVNCGRYTADPSAMHLSNGLQRGWKNKEFYSLFLSKPFGDSDLGRVNNILIYEEGGGYWDRIDVEYSLSDELVLTGELNMYWGDENTTFGQFENSSNIQVGLKYLIE